MAFIIFWMAVFAIIAFLLGVICKGLAAIFNGMLEAVVYVGKIGLLSGFVAVALLILYFIVNGIITEGFLSVLGMIGLFILYIGLVWLLLGWLGKLIFGIVASVAVIVMEVLAYILEFAAGACENAYIKCINAIIRQLNK